VFLVSAPRPEQWRIWNTVYKKNYLMVWSDYSAHWSNIGSCINCLTSELAEAFGLQRLKQRPHPSNQNQAKGWRPTLRSQTNTEVSMLVFSLLFCCSPDHKCVTVLQGCHWLEKSPYIKRFDFKDFSDPWKIWVLKNFFKNWD